MSLKYKLVAFTLFITLAALVWFANSNAFNASPIEATTHKAVNDENSVAIEANNLQQNKPLATKNEQQKLTIKPFCKDQTRLFTKFERDKAQYLSLIATTWKLNGESHDVIVDAFKALGLNTAIERFEREAALVTALNEANQQKLETILAEPINFTEYVKNKHQWRFTKWSTPSFSKGFIETYRQQAQRYPDIASAILQSAFMQLTHIEQPDVHIESLISLYDSYYSLNPNSAKLLTSNRLPFILNTLSPQSAERLVENLLLIEQLSSSNEKTQVASRVGVLNKTYTDLIEGTAIDEPQAIASDALQSKISAIIREQKLSRDELDVCQLYDAPSIDSQISIDYINAASLDYPHPSCDRQLSKRANEIGMVALYSEVSAVFGQSGIDLNQLNDAEKIDNTDFTNIKEYLSKKTDFERELAYLLIYSRTFHNQRQAVIEALIDKGMYTNNANAVAALQRLEDADAQKLLNKMGDIDNPNQRGESVIYNLMFIKPTLTVELINQGYTLKHTAKSPDPLLKILYFFRDGRESKKWLDVLSALVNNGAGIEPQHINEAYRLKLTAPEIFEKIIRLHPELLPEDPARLQVVQCHST